MKKLLFIALKFQFTNIDFLFRSGKRRYDRKQKGYGGQTKPVFRKKVRFNCVSFQLETPGDV